MSVPVAIGDLRNRVAIERAVRTSDGGGGFAVTWELVVEVWAAIIARGAGEALELDRVAGTATHDIWIRYRTGILPEMRMRMGGREFDIRGVIDPDERRRWLKCVVEERDL